MIDNFSKYVKAAPKLSLTTRPTCQDAPSGQVAVAVTGAPGPYAYKWLPGGETTDCIASLAAGDYEVTVTAANGLTTRAQATVKVDSLLSHATVTSAPCFDQPEHSIAVNTRGGMPPYRYYFNGSSTGTYTPVFRKLSPGSYHILVKDQRGCSQELNDVVVKGPPQLIIQQSTVIPATCGDMANGRIIPLVQGGTPPYVYQVDNGPWQSDSVLQDLSSGYHSFNVKDKYQCITSGTADVATQWPNCLVMMPSAFSPNGDGINDVFRPKVYDEVLNYELAIYNRWGGLVFRSNDPYRGWDGIYKGLLQEVQGFTYICTFLDRNNMRQELRGVVMLVH
ncbi:T9SS type B sorting domain-containing protein [Chitinophaga japonensis]|nr:gliding motility-associated C-terminal domain-containing protein [Chitinophaga japonensis]